MDPRRIAIADYTYHLPPDKIALHPGLNREQSKLLIYKHGQISEDIYQNIAQHLPENSLMVFNNSKVIPARILFSKPSGGVIEMFCLEPFDYAGQYFSAINITSPATWKCMIGGASKWKSGPMVKTLQIEGTQVVLSATLKEKLPDAYITEFSWSPSHYSFAEVIQQAGAIPLPPYIKREVSDEDKSRYQTVYALSQGSVAAPTAGLHFTDAIFTSLGEKKIASEFVTLHVGAGTFKPVKAEFMADHDMHAEWMELSIESVMHIAENIGKQIIAVGTTSLRIVESIYWMGVKAFLQPQYTKEYLAIKQWDVFDAPLASETVQPADALQALAEWMKTNGREKLCIKTQMLIMPGYQFRIVNALVTNFHQPNSTLLLLVAATIGYEWKKIYNYALENNFRFLSYGDGCLIFLPPSK